MKRKKPFLSPNGHLTAVLFVAFASIGFTALLWSSIIQHFFSESWQKIIEPLGFILSSIIPIFLFDKFVPSRCPKCEGWMFGSSWRPPWKRCQDCGYLYEYKLFGKN